MSKMDGGEAQVRGMRTTHYSLIKNKERILLGIRRDSTKFTLLPKKNLRMNEEEK
jgi:hypothetical protein